MQEIWERGAVSLAASIRKGRLSSKEVVDAFLGRIEAVNPNINAVIALAGERAREEASTADAALARGDAIGPLNGVPFTAKDVFDSEGLETSAGILERRGTIAAADAVAVDRMRNAGAILLGKAYVPAGGR